MHGATQCPLSDGSPLFEGTYIIESRLGTGGFGITYRAQEPKRRRNVAVKEFFPAGCARQGQKLTAGGDWEDETLARYKNSFLEECRVLSTLRHPGIVGVHRFFMENDTIYLAMEYVEGQTVNHYLKEHGGALPIETALAIIREAGEALKIVHEAGLLHRDLKPDNIMLRPNGSVVLIDFGAAREVLPFSESSEAQILTEGYAPLEQYPLHAERGPYTDIYALAATLYKLLTGEKPTPSRLREKFPLSPPRELRVELSAPRSEAVMWGLQLNPEDRPQTIDDFLNALFPPTRAAAVPPPSPITELWQPLMTQAQSLFKRWVPSARPPDGKAARVVAQEAAFIGSTPPAARINPADGAEMLWIPAGEFIMGSGEYHNEQPQRCVTQDGFYIYKTPVTVAQYQKFCQATRRKMPPPPAWGWIEDHPMVNVSWKEAKAYCKWAGVSLPTETQWEKAARGIDGRKYPWGSKWDSSKCHCTRLTKDDVKRTASVGSYPEGASPYGALGMAGNVEEWCEDWYEAHYYKHAPDHNPEGPASGTQRVLRGGSWLFSDAFYFRGSERKQESPDSRKDYIGFRCVIGDSR